MSTHADRYIVVIESRTGEQVAVMMSRDEVVRDGLEQGKEGVDFFEDGVEIEDGVVLAVVKIETGKKAWRAEAVR